MTEPKRLHVAFFPWLAFGHMIPFLELAKRIAQKGHKISFLSTSRNIQRLPKIPSNLSSNINFISLPLPQLDNLPPGAEATIDLPFDKFRYLRMAYDSLKDPLVQFLETSTPNWVIYDCFPYWLPPILADLGISSAFFSIFGGWTLTFWASPSSAMIDGDDSRFQPEDFTVPPKWIPFPSKVAYRLHEAKKIPHRYEVDNSGIPKHIFGSVVSSVMANTDIVAIRSCFELEADFLRLVRELHGKPVFPVGLLPPFTLDGNGDEDDTWLKIQDWLDKQEKGSVVYIAFGSEVDLSQNEFTELALGLEQSGLPFFWASRKRNDYSVELPDGFEERVEGRGLVWTSWVPQPRILSHESVGGFLTHCGFSSIIDALYSGCALIMLPITFDHGLIARVFEDMKVGVEIIRDEEDGSFTRDSVADSVRLVIAEEEGKLYREKAKEMRKLFANKELHDRYIDQFVEFLQTHGVPGV